MTHDVCVEGEEPEERAGVGETGECSSRWSMARALSEGGSQGAPERRERENLLITLERSRFHV